MGVDVGLGGISVGVVVGVSVIVGVDVIGLDVGEGVKVAVSDTLSVGVGVDFDEQATIISKSINIQASCLNFMSILQYGLLIFRSNEVEFPGLIFSRKNGVTTHYLEKCDTRFERKRSSGCT